MRNILKIYVDFNCNNFLMYFVYLILITLAPILKEFCALRLLKLQLSFERK